LNLDQTTLAHGHAASSLRWLESILPGLTLVAIITAAAYGLRQVPGLSGLSPMISAIFIGIAFASFTTVPAAAKPGVALFGKGMLRLAIVLLGFQLTLGQLGEVGLVRMLAICALVATTFVATLALGRLLGINPGLARLLAAGTSICGASAIAAANAVRRTDDEDVAYAVACITVFGTISMLVYPLLGQMAQLSPADYGFWAGSSIHEVAQVVAAGFQHGDVAGEQSVVVKLSRVVLLAPLLIAMSALSANRADAAGKLSFSQIIPTFVIGFVACMVINTVGIVPPPLKALIVEITPVMLAAALGALGLGTRFSAVRARGARPLLVAALASVFISAASFLLLRTIL
jgi:uncharacterized integral membrane protein (TIGR00698 family)